MITTLIPRVSEKSFAQASSANVYTFIVPDSLSKIQIKKLVEEKYSVSVLTVNISILKGKHKRFMQKRGKQSSGTRSNIRKAYVTLKNGDSIPEFNFVEPEAPKNETKPEKTSSKKGEK